MSIQCKTKQWILQQSAFSEVEAEVSLFQDHERVPAAFTIQRSPFVTIFRSRSKIRVLLWQSTDQSNYL